MISSTKDLRDFLVEQMTLVAKGEQEAPNAKAICNYAQQIYNTVNMELKAAKLRADMPDVIVGPVDFG
jgi:hypothetical protein